MYGNATGLYGGGAKACISDWSFGAGKGAIKIHSGGF
jgi:hypothetical protein